MLHKGEVGQIIHLPGYSWFFILCFDNDDFFHTPSYSFLKKLL
jgi:hypothetical protein